MLLKLGALALINFPAPSKNGGCTTKPTPDVNIGWIKYITSEQNKSDDAEAEEVGVGMWKWQGVIESEGIAWLNQCRA